MVNSRCTASLTVFTPTYNRAHTLPRLYQSLLHQTRQDFEWLIVDDGSADGTDQLVGRWQGEAPFPLRYLRQKHGGKHVAFNRGVREARGQLFVPVDSDDYLLPHALERIVFHWQRIPEKRRGAFSGMTFLYQDEQGRIIGDPFPAAIFDSNFLAVQYRYRVHGDKFSIFRTSVLRKLPFPENLSANYVPESMIWNQMARTYRTRFVNEPLGVVCSTEDQITRRAKKNPAQDAMVRSLGYLQTLNTELDYFPYHPSRFLHAAYQYIRLSLLSGANPLSPLRQVRSPGAFFLVAALLPIGWAGALADLLKQKSNANKESAY